MPRQKVISIEIQPGDVIVGLASFGQASYEDEYNSGMGSNGLTSSRHDLFCQKYIEKYPETFDPILLTECPKLVYRGNNEVLYKIPNKIWNNHPYHKPLNVGRLVLSPTRTYAPIIQQVVNNFKPGRIHGIIHCSGGGQTKVMNYVNDVHIIKDNLFNLPPVFQMIRENYVTHLHEMYKSFNMGHRMEIYVQSEKAASVIIGIAKSFNVEAQIIGHVEAATEKKLTIKSELGEFTY
jgi:phosphoribosylformylglycinamidine cyclo-ligase